MVSGVGFQNTASEDKGIGRHKKKVSGGLIIAATILGLVIIIWIGLKMQNKSLDNELAALEADTLSINTQIGTALSGEASDSALRAYTMEKELYTEYEVNDVLDEIENIMILESSNGNRVVLKSFQFNAGANTKKSFKDGDATITSAGSVTITADADTFDVMAQQIEVFKESSYFDNVQVGTTDRDDSGRIIFTLTMDVVGYDKSPYESGGATGSSDIQNDLDVNVDEEVVETGDTMNEAESVVGEDEVNGESGETEVVTGDDGVSAQTENADVQVTQ